MSRPEPILGRLQALEITLLDAATRLRGLQGICEDAVTGLFADFGTDREVIYAMIDALREEVSMAEAAHDRIARLRESLAAAAAMPTMTLARRNA